MNTTYEHFHSGEVAVQAEWGTDTGEYEEMSRQMMRPEVNPQEHAFIDNLSFSFAGSVDATGRPWASPLLSDGRQLFKVTSPTTVAIAVPDTPGDPLFQNVGETGELSVAFFSPQTRRRAKSIGRGAVDASGALTYEMTRLFGLCPKYIFKRDHEPSAVTQHQPVSASPTLSPPDQRQLSRSDTVFFASFSPHGADVTHRGGNPGFIEVVDDSHLEIPDYFGNGMFNTLGNLKLDNRMAITDVDFATGRTIHLTGRARVRTTGLSLPQPERSVSFEIEEVRISNPPIGAWTDVEASRYSATVL